MRTHISHSQIDTWEQCPHRWYLTKVQRVPRAPGEALVLGTALHAAIEADGRAIMAGADHLDLDTLSDLAFKAMADELSSQDPQNLLSTRIENMEQRLETMVRAYCQHLASFYRPVAVEKEFTWQVGSIGFTGRIDAITNPDQGRTIVDFKTASNWKRWQPGTQHHKDQATAYSIAEPLATRQVFVVLMCPPENPALCEVKRFGTTRNDSQRAFYRAKVAAVAAEMAIARKTHQATPKPGILCRWCEVQNLCEVGRQHLAANNWEPAVPVLKG